MHDNHHEIIGILKSLDDLPSHDPNRFEALDGYDNPECTNEMHAVFASEPLAIYQKICRMNEEVEVAVGDLICDLLHLVHSGTGSPRMVLETALRNFVAEAGRS